MNFQQRGFAFIARSGVRFDEYAKPAATRIKARMGHRSRRHHRDDRFVCGFREGFVEYDPDRINCAADQPCAIFLGRREKEGWGIVPAAARVMRP